MNSSRKFYLSLSSILVVWHTKLDGSCQSRESWKLFFLRHERKLVTRRQLAFAGFQLCKMLFEKIICYWPWLWLWCYKIQVPSVIGPCSGSQYWNCLASVVWGWCQSDRYCDKTEIGLGGLGMVPIRSLFWQFRLGILGRTLKVVLPSACRVFSWRSLPMVLLLHCPGGCSRGSPLCLQVALALR